MAREVEVVEVAGREVRLSSPSKVFFPARGETKRDLVDYYLRVGDEVLRALGDRPVMLQRFPDGAGGSSFFQKRVPPGAPPWLATTTVRTVNGTPSRVLVLADLAHVVWAVNLGCLGFHAWPFHAGHPDAVDELRIDLDPQPGSTFAMVCEAAALARDLLGELGLEGFVKTSGSRGLHVYVPLEPVHDSFAVRSGAVALARELERRRPDLVTAAWWKEERGPRVFVDFNQNAPHKTVFAAWSVRAVPTATVSCPFGWDELDRVDPAELTLATVPDRVAAGGDPWAAKPERAGDLEPLVSMARRDADAGLPDAPWPPEYPKMAGEATRVAPSRARARTRPDEPGGAGEPDPTVGDPGSSGPGDPTGTAEG